MNKYTIVSHGPAAGMYRLVLYRGGRLIRVVMAAHFQDAYQQLMRLL